MGGGCELLWDRRSGDSKANSRLGWVCLLGEVVDFCHKRSCETVSEMFDFCDIISWDVAAFALGGHVLHMVVRGDSGKLFSLCMLGCFCSCCFANHAGNIFTCLSPIFGPKVKPGPASPKLGTFSLTVAFSTVWVWLGLDFV